MAIRFVRLKACRCGNVCSAVQTGELGEFVLFEVDRALSGDDNSKEIVLYPLQLEQVGLCRLYTEHPSSRSNVKPRLKAS